MTVSAIQAWRSATFPGFGTILVGAGAAGIFALDLVDPGLAAHRSTRNPVGPHDSRTAPPEGGAPGDPGRHVERALGEIGEYLAGARTAFSVAVDPPGLSAFSRRVLEEAARIPWGCAVTYGALARAIGCPGGARAVGQALGRNPVPLLVPCHRVLAGGGRLGGFSGGLDWKRRLLRIEAIAWMEPRAD